MSGQLRKYTPEFRQHAAHLMKHTAVRATPAGATLAFFPTV
jgi:hypothetical protein